MAHLLMHWLNHELQLSTVVTDIDRDFASGYLLGEVLWQLNHQHNFSDFMNSSIADAKIVNFCLLEPSLRSMGVPLDATTATAIMNGTKGAAASFLYQIKVRCKSCVCCECCECLVSCVLSARYSAMSTCVCSERVCVRSQSVGQLI